jgi:hypothetical protein
MQPGVTRTLEFSLQPQATAPTPPPAAPTPERALTPHRKEVLQGRTIVLATGVAVTGAAAVVTSVFAVRGSNARGRERTLRTQAVRDFGYSPCSTPAGVSSTTCSDLARAVEDRSKANGVANLALGVTAGAGIATLAVLLLWPRDQGEEVEPPKLSPGATGCPAGLTLTGSF